MIRPNAVLPWLLLCGALLVSDCVVQPAYPAYGYAPVPAYYAAGGYYYGGHHHEHGNRW